MKSNQSVFSGIGSTKSAWKSWKNIYVNHGEKSVCISWKKSICKLWDKKVYVKHGKIEFFESILDHKLTLDKH